MTEKPEKMYIKFADSKNCRIFAVRFERNRVLIGSIAQLV